jgi:hypothetical protein
MNRLNNIFIDGSVNTGDISDDLSDEAIRNKIRDEYLKDTTITILLVGLETKKRKHIDWELYSSMHDGTVNKKSGIIVVVLPSADKGYYTASQPSEKETLYSDINSWISINDRNEYERRYPYLPDRIIDNLLSNDVKISVAKWDKVYNNFNHLKFLIEATHKNRTSSKYDMSRQLRRQNS